MLDKYRDDIDNCKKDLSDIKTWYKQIPNLLTLSRPIGIIPANILFFTGNVIPAIVLTGLLLSTDFFDGKLARKWGVQSKLGADMDAVGDKIMFFGMALPLLVSSPSLILNFILEGAISVVNLMGRVKGLDTKTVYSGKVKTVFLSLTLLAGYMKQFLNTPGLIFNILKIITCYFQGYALSEYINEYKRMNFEKQMNEIYKDIEDKKIKLVRERSISDKILELRKEREFYLGYLDKDKVYTGKKRVRMLIHEKRNSHI